MTQPFHIKAALTALALGLLAGCAAQTDLQKARDDTAAAVRISAAAEATAASATEKAGKATQMAEQAKQLANATASRAESAARPAAPSTPVSTPTQPAEPVAPPAEPVTPAEPVAPPAEPVAPAEPVTPPAEPVVAPVEPVSEPAAPAGDAVAGQAKARRCQACHSFDAGGRHRMGPNLFGVTTRPAGTAAGYNYSSGLGNAGFDWDAAKLAAWVCDSKEAIKQLTGNADARTTMANQRVCGADAANVAAYLETLK